MKKTLLAIAALAATSGAFAQSSLTVYGVLDASIESVKGDNTVTRVSSDNLATSRLGFKGTEDLGGGLRGNFVLETAVKSDTGAQGNTARFFDRAAWLGVQGGFGELRLGRIDSSIGLLAGDSAILGAQPYDDFKIAPTRAGNTYRRVDNSITYLLPQFVPGLTAQLQYATKGVGFSGNGISTNTAANEDNTDSGRLYGLNIKYVAGPFQAGAGYLYSKDELAVTAGDQKANAALAFAGYDFGPVRVLAYFDTETSVAQAGGTALTGANNKRFRMYGAKIAVPFSPDFVLTASASQAKNVAGLDDDDTANLYSLKGVYSLSKRTALYGMVAYVDNDANSRLNVSSVGLTADDKKSHGVAIGVRHSF